MLYMTNWKKQIILKTARINKNKTNQNPDAPDL